MQSSFHAWQDGSMSTTTLSMGDLLQHGAALPTAQSIDAIRGRDQGTPLL